MRWQLHETQGEGPQKGKVIPVYYEKTVLKPQLSARSQAHCHVSWDDDDDDVTCDM
jgi:hypothetical protein